MAYNGWKNYETWNVALWLDNDQALYATITAMVEHEYTMAVPSTHFTKEEQAVLTVADRLKIMIEEDKPDLGASCYADLLNAAISECDWREIAQHYIDECEKDSEMENA